jgi:uncharacterized protein (TIGR03435 family)
MQRLLADRFGLVVHHERKSVPFYYLVLGQDAVKLLTPAAPEEKGVKNDAIKLGPSQFHAKAAAMQNLAHGLSQSLPRLVLDKTNLNGLYVLDLAWTADPNERLRHGHVSTTLPDASQFDVAHLSQNADFMAGLEKAGVKLTPEIADQVRKSFFAQHSQEPPAVDPSPDRPLPPTLVAELERLGLKLQPHEDLTDIVVVDHAERVKQGQ